MLTAGAGRISYLDDDEHGIAIFASDRAALIAACPEYEDRILASVERVDAARPVWLALMHDCEEPIIGHHVITTDGRPAWWIQAQAGRERHQ
jgi:hypothetical protein